MEFPELGQHCSHPSCQQLDFLPMKCDACSRIYCRDHIVYATHNCTESYKKDNQVPVCPLCNLPCPIKKGELPDIVIGRHIESDCLSDPATEKRKVYTNKCSKKGCKQKELVPVRCESCRQNYCLRHRHEQDHECQGFQASARSVSNAGAAAILRAQQAASKKPSSTKPSSTAPASVPSPSHTGNLNRNSNNSRRPETNVSSLQGSMSEEEALARALQMSMNGNGSNASDGMTAQEREDFLLAQALAESEQEAAASSRQLPQQQARPQRTMDKCSVQ
ncbi:hypothetical protein BsWGS_27079 [Bradybaena similaris]